MIDLHCHLLPFVDDGPRTVAEAVELAAACARDGITHSVVTPHAYPGRWENTTASLQRPFEAFRRLLSVSGVRLELRLGAEVHLLPESLELAARRVLPTIGSWGADRVLLLELPDARIPLGTENAVAHLRGMGYVPLVAHPERNKEVMRRPDRLRALIDAGCLLQLTAASVVGAFGAPAFRCAQQLLDAGWVTAIASDAHHVGRRPPMMSRAREHVSTRWGPRAAAELTRTNPGRIFGVPEPVVEPAPAFG